MLRYRKILCGFLSLFVLSFSACASEKPNLKNETFYSLPLNFQKIQPLKLSPFEKLFMEGKYAEIVNQKFSKKRSKSDQYIFFRSLYHLKEWKKIIYYTPLVKKRENAYWNYLLFYYLQALVYEKQYQKANGLFKRQEKLLLALPFKDQVQDTFEAMLAGLNAAHRSKNKGRFYFYRSRLNLPAKIKRAFFLKALSLGDKKAFSLLNKKNFFKIVSPSNRLAYASRLESINYRLSAYIYKKMRKPHFAGSVFFKKHKYKRALKLLNPNSKEAVLCRVALNKASASDIKTTSKMGTLASRFLYRYYIKNKKVKELFKLLSRKYKKNVLRLVITESITEKQYKILKTYLLKAVKELPLDLREKAMAFYWLAFIYAKEGNFKEADKYYRIIAMQYPFSFYGRIAIRELKTSNDFKNQQDLFVKNSMSKIQPYLEKVNRSEIPAEIEHALLFLKIGELKKGFSILKHHLGEDLSPYYLKLTEFFANKNSMLCSYFANKLYLDISKKTNSLLFYKNLFKYLVPLKYENIILQASKQFSLRSNAIASIIRQESSFNAEAVSWVGAQGLMQLMPKTAAPILKSLSKKKIIKNKNIFDPHTNIMCGSSYFAWLFHRFYQKYPINHRLALSFASYNAGPSRMKRHFHSFKEHPVLPLLVESIYIKETRNYVKRIWVYLDVYKYMYSSKLRASKLK